MNFTLFDPYHSSWQRLSGQIRLLLPKLETLLKDFKKFNFNKIKFTKTSL